MILSERLSEKPKQKQKEKEKIVDTLMDLVKTTADSSELDLNDLLDLSNAIRNFAIERLPKQTGSTPIFSKSREIQEKEAVGNSGKAYGSSYYTNPI